ncbi:MAG TPA: L-seryl-tRNA(Sec) selenium transferase [Pyrinomonadaceae bacterium]|nr:L-seryl-tRNA(Sec) selenium transferase [Pyrinomonadaceae bacterium]
MTSPTSQPSPLQAIPSVDQLLKTDAAAKLRDLVGAVRLTEIARQITDDIRREIQRSGGIQDRQRLLSDAIRRLEQFREGETSAGIRRVINATGVVLHTNLGRAPLSESARTAVVNAAGYCTVELDAQTGKRGHRGARVEQLLCQITGAESALVVNNCAAAALLVLTVLARDGETVVSRGELVEIGGDFRVPDVMSNSGTRMIEVGTTNRTRLEDYRRAITDQTRLIMRVHPSNYRVVGFTATPKLEELVALAHELHLPIYEDAGSGVVNDLTEYGLVDEPLIRDSIDAGVDVVSFSGDKLLGAAQAGLIVGKQSVIERLRKHSMYRALRVDKLCLAALEATLESHRRGASEEIPTLHMLAMSAETLQARATAFVANLADAPQIKGSVVQGKSAVGGGSGPNVHPPTWLVAIEHDSITVEQIERQMRAASPPIIARIAEGRLLLDLRTVEPTDEPEILTALKSVA